MSSYSALQINLSFSIKQMISEFVGNLKNDNCNVSNKDLYTIFDKVIEEMKFLLLGSFNQRFKKTVEYKRLLEKFN